MSLPVLVLLSVARHPVSDRSVVSRADAAALRLALALPGAEVRALHAGDPDEPALRLYLGLGLGRIDVLSLPPGMDAEPPLAAEIARRAPALVLCGDRAEGGLASGLLPARLAAALDRDLALGVRAVVVEGNGLVVDEARPHGAVCRRRIRLPALLACASGGLALSAAGPARRGVVQATEVPPDLLRAAPHRLRAARPRAVAIEPPRGHDFAERLDAVLGAGRGGGGAAEPVSPEEAARRILALLAREGFSPGT